ncbi:unnamed protein product [Vitrella brassicaformis CCMP3155]|uniref:2-methoxy-6-polyprenyl-1,4-benzoquinol methylase, mitochondrial n=1 Tax=Vitrella brassicaformis (strain CCMP3155) TaxID=1169540 RepID=A0A0G4EDJ6_VITBC|nr:unnamed protein product [Vitrella brassicaformis CCMP3155]|eukprot:CEL93580.1 unnamed protein product [Vitrella brassicaformis CCMP3155]
MFSSSSSRGFLSFSSSRLLRSRSTAGSATALTSTQPPPVTFIANVSHSDQRPRGQIHHVQPSAASSVTFRRAMSVQPGGRAQDPPAESFHPDMEPPTYESDVGKSASSSSSSSQVPFGFQSVAEDVKARLVGNVFTSVADRYDLMNDLMSGGVHRIWKDQLVDLIDPPLQPYTEPPAAPFHVLDVAGGTGDIAFRVIRKVENKLNPPPFPQSLVEVGPLRPLGSLAQCSLLASLVHPRRASSSDSFGSTHFPVRVTVCDANEDMLRVGRQKAAEQNLPGLDWVCADGESLPFEDSSIDVVTIAFGIRNFTHIDRGLSEAYRVLKPGGRFLCLEFSKVENAAVGQVYDLYSFQLIPLMGQLVANDRNSYQYLVESIRKFPPQEEFAQMMHNAGFTSVTFTNMTFGVVAIHSGFKMH